MTVFAQKNTSDRDYWVDRIYELSAPVLKNMSKGELKKNMNMEFSPAWDNRNSDVAYLEAFGRLMDGIAPWLALPDDNTPEGKKRKEIRTWALQSYKNAVDPKSPDCLNFQAAAQSLVDAAFLASSFIRAPKALWEPLDEVTKARYVENFVSLRKIRPPYNNWLLFRMMVETFLVMVDEEYDGFVFTAGINKINEWYVGDGWYSDGSDFCMDYYNSYVIQPMFVEILEVLKDKKMTPVATFDLALRRMQRYNYLLERMISPEATFPLIGRSITYRMGAFQTLALSAWKYGLPEGQTNGQVRNALTAVMKRMFSVEGNYDKDGFLRLGLIGHQPNISDSYTNGGSLYLTSLVFMPLGLPADHPFWTDPAEPWTSQKAWDSQPFPKDYHQSIRR